MESEFDKALATSRVARGLPLISLVVNISLTLFSAVVQTVSESIQQAVVSDTSHVTKFNAQNLLKMNIV